MSCPKIWVSRPKYLGELTKNLGELSNNLGELTNFYLGELVFWVSCPDTFNLNSWYMIIDCTSVDSMLSYS